MNYLYETHVHTSQVSKCATSTAQEQIYKYKQLGYTGVITTDHFVNGYSACTVDAPWDVRMNEYYAGYKAAKEAGDECGVDVFFGWEYTINGLDFLTYGLDLDFLLAHPELESMPIERYSALIRSAGGYIAQAHPYRKAWYIENPYPVESTYVDAVEVYNSMDTDNSNKRALRFATQNNLPVQAGSDCHNTSHLKYSGIILEHRAKDIFDIIHEIKSKNIKLIK